MRTHKFGVEFRFAVVEQQGNYFLKIGVQFIECFPLAVRAREPRHLAYVKLRVRATFDHGSIGVHNAKSSRKR